MAKLNSTKFVESLSDDVLRQMIADHEIFSQKGSIGDCELRDQTEKFLHQFGIPDTNIVLWMDRIMFDVFRNVGMRYIKICGEITHD